MGVVGVNVDYTGRGFDSGAMGAGIFRAPNPSKESIGKCKFYLFSFFFFFAFALFVLSFSLASNVASGTFQVRSAWDVNGPALHDYAL